MLAVTKSNAFSFKCYPCYWDYCSVSSPNKSLSIPGYGSLTCAAIESNAQSNTFDPEDCGYVQEQLLSSNNPCGCRITGTDRACPSPPTNQNDICRVCPNGKRVGDPNFVVPFGLSLFGGFLCGDMAAGGLDRQYDRDICGQASSAASAHCSCYDPSVESPPRQCVAQNKPCDENADTCCEGECVFQGEMRCSVNPGFPTSAPAPQPDVTPLPSPSMSPSVAPIAQALGAAAEPQCVEAGETCDVDGMECCGNLPCIQSSRSDETTKCKKPAGSSSKCDNSLRGGRYGGSGGC